MNYKQYRWAEELERRLTLSAVGFAAHTLIESEHGGLRTVVTADLDGDQKLDVLIATAGKLSWYKNAGSDAGFEDQRVIARGQFTKLRASDIDGDGDQDVLAAGAFARSGSIGWYENIDGRGHFRERKLITSEAFLRVGNNFLSVTDVDGDTDLDVLASTQRTDTGDSVAISWFENVDAKGTFAPKQVITDSASVFESGDVDGDGDADLVSVAGSRWLENVDGVFSQEHLIPGFGVEASPFLGASSLFIDDLDSDGDADITFVSVVGGLESDTIGWHENLDGQGKFSEAKTIAKDLTSGLTPTVLPADVDQDGDTDIVFASSRDGAIAWYENLNGRATFSARRVIRDGGPSLGFPGDILAIHAGDLDGDGDVDIVTASDDRDEVAWFENTDANGTFGAPNVITEKSNPVVPTSVFAADLDGDGDQDLLSTSEGSDVQIISWYKNTNAQGAFDDVQTVMTIDYLCFGCGRPIGPVHPVDVDGDGDLDVISGSKAAGEIVWSANVDGMGDFGEEQAIPNFQPGTDRVGMDFFDAADLDGDGDADIVFATSEGIAWLQNIDGQTSFSEPRMISDVIGRLVRAADFDKDNDMDVLVVTSEETVWFENTNAQGAFARRQAIETHSHPSPRLSRVEIVDMDGDQDVDLIASQGNTISWYRNTDGDGAFGRAIQIATSESPIASVRAMDMDNDGDVDLVASSGDSITWYENGDGEGQFAERLIVDDSSVTDIFLSDINTDGYADVIYSSGRDRKLAWYENRLAGDLDGDGEVSFTDFLILSANFGSTDVGWPGGDLDGDRSVSFADFLILSANFGRIRGNQPTV